MLLLQGILLGFSIAAPVGPIGVLCIRRTLADGRLMGFLSGPRHGHRGYVVRRGRRLWPDRRYNLAGGTTILGYAPVGGLFLLYLGTRTFLAKPSAEIRSFARGQVCSAPTPAPSY